MVCVVVGVVVNVGVAWGLVLWVQLGGLRSRAIYVTPIDQKTANQLGAFHGATHLPQRDLDWPLPSPDGRSPEIQLRYEWAPLRGCTHLQWTTGWIDATPLLSVDQLQSGLPLRTLEGFAIWHNRSTATYSWALDTGFDREYPDWPTAILPLRPVLPGFIVNTLFYTALVFAPVVGARVVRRHRRAKRGRCIACGYELADLTACPECGVPSSPRRGAGV